MIRSLAIRTYRTVRRPLRRLLKAFFGSNEKRGYQDRRFPQDQFQLISKAMHPETKNVLEIGCNQGRLSDAFARQGLFVLGLDVAAHWNARRRGTDAEEDNSPAAIKAVQRLDVENVRCLPAFDTIFLLSVHHQWVKQYGDGYAQELVGNLALKAERDFFVEFAALAGKYGYSSGEAFLDNDEQSICRYAESWLRAAGIRAVHYLGQTRENPPKEPFRFLFHCKPSR